MKIASTLLHSSKNIFKYLIILLLLAVSIKYLVKDAFHYLSNDKNVLSDFWDYRWTLYAHIICGMVALIIGPLQFWTYFRNRYLKTHRLLGKIYLIAIFIGAWCGTSLAWTVTIGLNFAFPFSLQILAVAWVITAAMAYLSIRRKRIAEHREWMIRSYIVTFAFVSFRYLADLQILRDVMATSAERAPTIIWFTWALPLLIAEVIMSWNRGSKTT